MTDAYTEADLYCAAFDWPLDEEVDWVLMECERLLGRRPRSVLEPMCGNARYGPEFAQRGVRYHGIDLSPDMLDRSPAHEAVTTSCADVRNFQIEGAPFDFAWCPINSIRHMPTRKDLNKHLQCVARHLPADGLYLVETMLTDHDGPFIEDKCSTWDTPQPDGSIVKAWWGTKQADLATRRIREYARFERHRDGKCVARIDSTYEMLLMTSNDWQEWPTEAGFQVEQVIETLDDGQRIVVPLSPALKAWEKNVLLFLRRTNDPRT